MRRTVFSSEAVTSGHPDKLCDQVSDAVVDRFLHQDPLSDIVAECAVSTGILFVAAHFASDATVDVPGLAREVVGGIGYDDESFNPRTASVMTSLNPLPEPLRTPRRDECEIDDEELSRIVANDQVTLFGFACRHSPSLMPLPVWLASRLARRLGEARSKGELPYLSPDGKTQVAVEFREREPLRIHSVSVVASRNGEPAPDLEQVRRDIREQVVDPVFQGEEIGLDGRTEIHVNRDGELRLGGPVEHSGLTGRKTASDTYGEYARHSGSALSGKGPRRIDRTGAYAARHAAKNVVAAGLADECELQLTYVIGLAEPASVEVQTFGSGRIPDEEISQRVRRAFDLRPGAIVRAYELHRLPRRRGIDFYRDLAAHGHVGRLDGDLPWERTDRVDDLR